MTGQLGTTFRIKLDPVGLLTGLLVRATCRVDIAGTVQTPGNESPYSLLPRLRLQDDRDRSRIELTGPHAHALACLYDGNAGVGNAGVMYQYPLIPTAIGTNQLLDVTFRLPIAADPLRDLRGAMYMPGLSQTYLFCDFVNAFVVPNDDTAVYKTTTGTVTLNTSTQQPTIEVWQEYIDYGGALPVDDLNVIHYLTGAQYITSGLAANAEFLIDYPVQRSVRALVMSQVVNGLQARDNAAELRSLFRSNYTALDNVAAEQFVQQRRRLSGTDLKVGYWFLTHAPEVFARFSREYQAGFTPAVTGASQQLQFTFDTFGA